MPVKRIRTPSSVDKVQHSSDSFQSTGGPMTPSPGSFSMGYPSQNPASYKVPTPVASTSSVYSPISPRGPVQNPATGGIPIPNRPTSGQLQSFMQISSPQANQTVQNPAAGGISNQSRPSSVQQSFMQNSLPPGHQTIQNPAAGRIPNQSRPSSVQQSFRQNPLSQASQSGFANPNHRSNITLVPFGNRPMSPNGLSAPANGKFTLQQMRQMQEHKMMSSEYSTLQTAYWRIVGNALFV